MASESQMNKPFASRQGTFAVGENSLKAEGCDPVANGTNTSSKSMPRACKSAQGLSDQEE
jgi:hypothetical protein